MKNNIISYAERKRICLKLEKNNSMYNNQSNKIKKESNLYNKPNHNTKIKRLNSYKESLNVSNQIHKDNITDKSILMKDGLKENLKLFKKVNLNKDNLRNKKIVKNNDSIATLKHIDINININNNNSKLFNNKSSVDYDDFKEKEKKNKNKISNNNHDIMIYKKTSLINKKKYMNNSYCSSNKYINKIINNLNNNFISVTSKSSRKNDLLIVQDEILELKLLNSRANNEIIILKEKNNSLNDIIDLKEKEIQMIKKNFIKLIDEANDEKIKLKNKLENEYKLLQKKYDISIKVLKSLIETVIELTETIIYNEKNNNNMIFSNKNIANNLSQISFSGAGECSIDIYDSNSNIENNNKEDDKENKKNIILNQIKEIIIEKINNIIYKLNLVLDNSILEKIEQLNKWNFNNFIVKYSPSYSFNLYNFPKRNYYTSQPNQNNLNDELFSGSLSKYNMSLNNDVSNDFDFSVSKSFYNPSSNISTSPKFNRSIKVENNNYINTSKNGNVKSLLFSLNEASKANIVKNKFKLNNTGNNNLNRNNHLFNILEYTKYASSNIHNIININNTVNNNNFTESNENNFKGFYESFSNSTSKNKNLSACKMKINQNNIFNLFDDSMNNNSKENKKEDINIKKGFCDIGNITLKDIEQ